MKEGNIQFFKDRYGSCRRARFWVKMRKSQTPLSTSYMRSYTLSFPPNGLRSTDNCNILTLYFKSGFSVEFRAYNDGVAYRFETFLKDDITVTR